MSLFDLPQSTPPAPAKEKPAKAAPQAREAMPAWLVRHLESGGHIDASKPGAFATRHARTVFCQGCHHGVMRGLTSLPNSLAVDADVVPLSARGEALALLAGIATYELRWYGGSYHLEVRTHYRIKNDPIDSGKHFDVLAQHRCGKSASWPTAATKLADSAIALHRTLSQEPPF